jgi:acyl carrier protein
VNEIELRIQRFITEELGNAGSAELTPDTPLLDDNLLDSVGIYELAVFLEDRYSIAISDEEMIPTNFGTISSLAKLVDSKR